MTGAAKPHERRFNALSVLVIDTNETRAMTIRQSLHEAGHADVAMVSEMNGLARLVEECAPDAIIVVLADPDHALIAHLGRITRAMDRPVAIFVDRSETAILETAIDAGISAYIVDGFRKDRVKMILDLAIARFNAGARLKFELAAARQALDDRKAVDRAKAVLQNQHGVAENEAYHLIRRQAMRENRRMGEIARAILLATEPPGG